MSAQADGGIKRVPADADAALAAAAEAFRGEDTMFAFISTPDRFEIGVLDGRAIRVVRDKKLVNADPDAAYELRVFCQKGDFHWLRDGESGSYVHLHEGLPKEKELDRHYLLWGEADAWVLIDGRHWACCRSPRVAPFWVPVAVPPKQEDGKTLLELTATEHVVRGVDGNAHVLCERLTGIAVRDTAPDKGEDD